MLEKDDMMNGKEKMEILIADNDPVIRKLFTRMTGKTGHSIFSRPGLQPIT
jgi:hypothetical protein